VSRFNRDQQQIEATFEPIGNKSYYHVFVHGLSSSAIIIPTGWPAPLVITHRKLGPVTFTWLIAADNRTAKTAGKQADKEPRIEAALIGSESQHRKSGIIPYINF
jgi:hypothetical protein